MKSKFFLKLPKLTFLSIMSFFFLQSAQSQGVLRGGIKAGFGVDGDVESDTARNGGATSLTNKGLGSDDWFKFIYKTGATGVGIIDTTGAYAIKLLKTSNPGQAPYVRRLNVPQHSIVNGKMLIDAVYGSDASGSTDSIFGPGGSVLEGPPSWTLTTGSATGKSDIVDFASHIRRDGTTYEDSLWMFLAMSYRATTGTKEGSMELFVDDVKYNHSTKVFSGYGNEAGRKAWRFNTAGEVIVPGDMAISYTYAPNTGVFTVDPMIWVADSNRNTGNAAYRAPTNFDYSTGTGTWTPYSGTAYGFQRIQPKSSNSFAYANASVSGSKAPPFGTLDAGGGGASMATTFGANQWVEFGMNLTALGVDPTNFSAININPCGVAYRTIMYRTTTSGTFNGSQKDIAGPYPFWRSAHNESKTHDTLNCINLSKKLELPKVANTVFYEWTALPGTAQMGTLGADSSMTVTKPGKYLLEYATEACVVFFDTFVVLQDTTKPVAKVTISDTFIEGSVYSVSITGGDIAATNARMSTNAAVFGPSQGLTWAWTGTSPGSAGFNSAIQSPPTADSGIYRLVIQEQRNGCRDTAFGLLVMLPVEFGPFRCGTTPEGIQLTWETYSERNTSHFSVQKWNGLMYENIGKVAAQGNSSSQVNYIYMDKNPVAGPNIYRIGLEARNANQMIYTEPCVTNLNNKGSELPFLFKVSPNPGKGEFTVVSALHADTRTTVFLYDLSGRVLKSESLKFNETGTSRINLSDVSSGIYILGIADGNHPQTTRLTIH